MRVHELITALQGMDPNAIVLVDGYEQDMDQAAEPVALTARFLPAASWYNGQFTKSKAKSAVPAVHLTRRKIK